MFVSVSTDIGTGCSKYVLNGTAAFLLELTEMNTCNRFEKYKYAEIENILADPDRALSLSLSLFTSLLWNTSPKHSNENNLSFLLPQDSTNIMVDIFEISKFFILMRAQGTLSLSTIVALKGSVLMYLVRLQIGSA